MAMHLSDRPVDARPGSLGRRGLDRQESRTMNPSTGPQVEVTVLIQGAKVDVTQDGGSDQVGQGLWVRLGLRLVTLAHVPLSLSLFLFQSASRGEYLITSLSLSFAVSFQRGTKEGEVINYSRPHA